MHLTVTSPDGTPIEDTHHHRRSRRMPEMRRLMTGLVFGESPRWHAGKLYGVDIATHEVFAVGPTGDDAEIVTRLARGVVRSASWTAPAGRPSRRRVSGAAGLRHVRDRGRPGQPVAEAVE